MDETRRAKPGNWTWRAIALLALAYVAGFLIFATTLPQTPHHPANADAIVALTGGDARLDAAVSLLETGAGKRLLITGVNSTTTKNELKRLEHGGPRFECCADLGFSAVNTRGNAAEAANWAHAHRYRSLILVTAAYHMPRSLAEFAARMPGVRLIPYPVQPDDLDLVDWWRDGRALRLLQVEYVKYLASLFVTHVLTPQDRAALDPGLAHGNAARPT
jgi:uncharacterized SAM-binding protein YcdF (DUF218 family)